MNSRVHCLSKLSMNSTTYYSLQNFSYTAKHQIFWRRPTFHYSQPSSTKTWNQLNSLTLNNKRNSTSWLGDKYQIHPFPLRSNFFHFFACVEQTKLNWKHTLTKNVTQAHGLIGWDHVRTSQAFILTYGACCQVVGIFDPCSLTIYEMDPSVTQSFSNSTSTSQTSVMEDFAQSSTMASSNEILFADTFIRQSGVDQSSDATPSLTDAILETDSFLVSSKESTWKCN